VLRVGKMVLLGRIPNSAAHPISVVTYVRQVIILSIVQHIHVATVRSGTAVQTSARAIVDKTPGLAQYTARVVRLGIER